MKNRKLLYECAIHLPEVTEGHHFHLDAFKVLGKAFIVIQNDGEHVILHIGRPEAESLAKKCPDLYDLVWRNNDIFVGIRAALSSLTGKQLQTLVYSAWAHKAPKSLVAPTKIRKT